MTINDILLAKNMAMIDNLFLLLSEINIDYVKSGMVKRDEAIKRGMSDRELTLLHDFFDAVKHSQRKAEILNKAGTDLLNKAKSAGMN